MIQTLLLLGSAQGLFLAVILAVRHTNSIANRILAALMLAFSLYIFQDVYYERGYYSAFPHFIGVSQPLIYAFGPLIYLYAKAVADGGRTFEWSSLLHLIPAIAVTLVLTPFYLLDGSSKVSLLEEILRGDAPNYLVVIENLQYPYGVLYVVLTVLLLRRHRARLPHVYSSTEAISLLWLRNLTIAVVCVWALAIGAHLLELTGLRPPGAIDTLTPLAVSVVVYAVGYFGWMQPEIFNPVAVAAPSGQATTESPSDRGPGYAKSGMSEDEAATYMEKLRRLMDEEALWRNSELTLPELANAMALSPHNMSEVINSRSGKNFYDFVNGYRVEEAKRLLRNPEYDHLTILAIAEEAGFNSKSTFNAFFRKETGSTPSAWRTSRHT